MIWIIVTSVGYALLAFCHSAIPFPERLSSSEIDSWKSTLFEAPLNIVASKITVLDKKGEVKKTRIQWRYQDGYAEESTTPEGAVSIYLANEKYSASLSKTETGYSIKSLDLINQKDKHFRSHLYATSAAPSEDGGLLFFPDLLANGDLVVSHSENEGDLRTFILSAPAGKFVAGLKSVELSFDAVSSPLPFRCIIENTDGNRSKVEFTEFADVEGYWLPAEGRPYTWNPDSQEWTVAEHNLWGQYKYMPEETLPTDIERLYLPFYGIAEPADPVGNIAGFGRKSRIPTVLGFGSVLALAAFCLWRFRKKE
jgi:hypothetical protein